jgi:hypothetical protein
VADFGRDMVPVESCGRHEMGGNPGVVSKLRSTGFGLGNASRRKKTIREGRAIVICASTPFGSQSEQRGVGGRS